MSSLPKTIVFGAIAGALWSIAPLSLSDFFASSGGPLAAILTAALTGILISLLLRWAFVASRGKWALLLGVASLPLSAFIFGFLISVVDILIDIRTNGSASQAIRYHDPFGAAFTYAAFSVLSVFALIFVPFAVFTTWCLRRIIQSPTAPL